MNFVVTNARSISAKTQSIVDNFRELDLHFMLVSETWLRNGKNATEVEEKLHDYGLKMISKNRGSRGGGVAIIFDTNRMVLKEAFAFPSCFEVTCALGRCLHSNKKVVIISVYIPPKTDAGSFLRLKVELREKLEQIRRQVGEFKVFVGGDTNKRDISDCFENFPAIKKLDCGPTRGDASLDECYTDAHDDVVESRTCAPLEDDHGTSSDHRVCFFKHVTRKVHEYTTRTFLARKYTGEAEEKFGLMLANVNWEVLRGLPPNEATDTFTAKLDELTEECFPLEEHKVRSCDKPWVTKRIKRMIRRKKRAFKRHGKNQNYKAKRDKTDAEVLANKVRFFGKVEQSIQEKRDPKAFYRAVNLLKTERMPNSWSISSLFPGESDAFIANESARFFNKISAEFHPVVQPERVDVSPMTPTVGEIVKKIRQMKKPSSSVRGDIDRRLVTRYAGMLAQPLQIIYRAIFTTNIWPDLWKKETVTLIPKNKAPDSLAQMRNISCTPFFSKVLESFMLDSLRETTGLSPNQFGGIKGQGVDHMLCEIWDEIHRGLERTNTAVNLTAIDFEKAFNRMDHNACLTALEELGANQGQLAMVAAFLSRRKMVVKIGNQLSDPLEVNGGAPQGSITGCYLFCATINKMLQTAPDHDRGRQRHYLPPSPIAGRAPSPDLTDQETDSEEDDNSPAVFFRWFKPRVINDSILSERATREELDDFLGPDDWEASPPVIKGYIDDLNVVEIVNENRATEHYTTGKTLRKIHAPLTEDIFEQIEGQAEDINMRVNPLKTQVLCMSTTTTADSTSYINHPQGRIESTTELKILGFYFDQKPGVSCHVKKMLRKVRGNLWALRNLRDGGLNSDYLLKTYCTYLRPILDFAVPTYHTQLTAELSSEIERFQSDAMKIIFGPLIAYHTILEHELVEEHQKRRQKIFEKFAKKALANETFKERWFPPNDDVEYDLRARKTYKEPFSKTLRYRNSPIQAMRRFLNTT